MVTVEIILQRNLIFGDVVELTGDITQIKCSIIYLSFKTNARPKQQNIFKPQQILTIHSKTVQASTFLVLVHIPTFPLVFSFIFGV